MDKGKYGMNGRREEQREEEDLYYDRRMNILIFRRKNIMKIKGGIGSLAVFPSLCFPSFNTFRLRLCLRSKMFARLGKGDNNGRKEI